MVFERIVYGQRRWWQSVNSKTEVPSRGAGEKKEQKSFANSLRIDVEEIKILCLRAFELHIIDEVLGMHPRASNGRAFRGAKRAKLRRQRI